MAHVLAEAPAPPVRAPTPAPQPRPRIYEGHAIDAALEQRLSLDAKRKSALDKREALIIRALAAVKRREDAVAERERRLDERTEALDRRERLLRAREDTEARRAKRLEDATMSADPRLPEIAKRLEAVEKLVDETAEVVSPSKEEEAQWRQRAKRRAATPTYDTPQSRQKQVEAYHNKKAYLKKSGRPRTAPPKKTGREPPHLDDMAVAREICRSLDVLSRETGESREAWRTKIFGASPPPKRQVSVTMPVASAPFAVAETCRQAVMSVDSLPGGPQAPRDVDRARLEETLRGRLRRARARMPRARMRVTPRRRAGGARARRHPTNTPSTSGVLVVRATIRAPTGTRSTRRD